MDIMNRHLSPDDIENVRVLRETIQRNNDVSWMLCDYLNENSCFITKELMDSVNLGGELNEETLYIALLTGACGLDIDNNEDDKQLLTEYFIPAVRQLDTKSYLDNPYYRNIIIPEVKFGNWELTYQKYSPYEAFIYKDLITESDFRQFPCIGFFNDEFRFPTVMEKAHEWMSLKPSEIETSQSAIDSIEGKVVTFGLGLGYFTYMASLKESVKSITVIERDPEVIRLFEYCILPQFQHPEKVEIISADAFEYVKELMPDRKFDYAFVDLWHDVSDGLEIYLKMKKLEYLNNSTKFMYWVEDSLLSGFRWQIFDWVIETARSYDEIVECLGQPFLKKLAATQFAVK